jgi:SAM-dependent methyltransferase
MCTTLVLSLLFAQGTSPLEKRRTAVPTLPNETVEQYWDRYYGSRDASFPTIPNGFLTRVVPGIKPGRALDIGAGQGRNSIYLAKLGWDVTGFDISEKGLAIAQELARDAGVKITTVKASLDQFDYGTAQWDLIVATYEGVDWIKAALRGLKPGGYIVLEGYGTHPNAPPSASFGPNALPKLFMDHNLQIVRYEDVKEEPEWLKTEGVVRIFARKPE